MRDSVCLPAMSLRLGLTFLTALLGLVVATACQLPVAQESAESVALANTVGEYSRAELAELILGSDRIVVGQVTDLIHVPQVWPIAPADATFLYDFTVLSNWPFVCPAGQVLKPDYNLLYI